MKLRNESVFVAALTTVGRQSGLPRTVELRLVYLNGKFYATTAAIEGKHWPRNMARNPKVKIQTKVSSEALQGVGPCNTVH